MARKKIKTINPLALPAGVHPSTRTGPLAPVPDSITALQRPTIHEVMSPEEQRDFARSSLQKIKELQSAAKTEFFSHQGAVVSERQVADNTTQLAAAKAGVDVMGLAPSKFADSKGSSLTIINIVEREQPNRPTRVIDVEAKPAD